MHVIGSSLGALTVAVVYYAYRDCLHARWRRDRHLRERVTYMLWVMANQMA